jgi:hypothetical protein
VKKNKKNKIGGVYGHFFHGLSVDIKKLILNRLKDNKKRIQSESFLSPLEIKLRNEKLEKKNKKNISDVTDVENFDYSNFGQIDKDKRDSFVPETTISKTRAKALFLEGLGEYDCGTANEKEMLEELYIAGKRLEKITIRIQRIRRIKTVERAARWLWRQKYAALVIQRVARGRFARTYAAILRKIYPLAATRIQLNWRKMRSRILRKKWRFLTFRLTRVIWPKIKKFLNNTIYSIYERKKEDFNAIIIQKNIRGFLGRVKNIRKIGEFCFFQVLVPTAVLNIQKIVRGYLGRRLFRLHIEQLLIRYI